MTTESVLAALVRANLAATVAILLVLALRPWLLRWFGARLTYWCWLIVPLVTTASFLPARKVVEFIEPSPITTVTVEAVPVPETTTPVRNAEVQAVPDQTAINIDVSAFLVAAWLLGGFALLGRSIIRSRRFAADPSAGPALAGVLRPRLVLPSDFYTRFTTEERALILAHEDQHRRSGHCAVNALVEIARCACWFNPLAHLASKRFRSDQELACDAAIVAARPNQRRRYAEALLKTQLSPEYLALVCSWPSRSARHLGERIAMLARPNTSISRIMVGVFFLAIVNVALGYAAWAQQPVQRISEVARPPASWTASAEAPDGTLTHQLEAERHDSFIELAQAGDIDLLFFGSTDTEMWSWQDRGKDVWTREFGSLKAANFGSQGTGPRSLLWRMQNGELDGFDAKLIVIQTSPSGLMPALSEADVARFHQGLVPIIAEIRARQPQAKILLMAPLPRGLSGLRQWRQQASSFDAAFDSLVDNETVFYINIGERFFNDDGSFKRETWSTVVDGTVSVGRQAPGFEIWADELQPWLDRFVR